VQVIILPSHSILNGDVQIPKGVVAGHFLSQCRAARLETEKQTFSQVHRRKVQRLPGNFSVLDNRLERPAPHKLRVQTALLSPRTEKCSRIHPALRLRDTWHASKRQLNVSSAEKDTCVWTCVSPPYIGYCAGFRKR
jgi:hypothetical protein